MDDSQSFLLATPTPAERTLKPSLSSSGLSRSASLNSSNKHVRFARNGNVNADGLFGGAKESPEGIHVSGMLLGNAGPSTGTSLGVYPPLPNPPPTSTPTRPDQHQNQSQFFRRPSSSSFQTPPRPGSSPSSVAHRSTSAPPASTTLTPSQSQFLQSSPGVVVRTSGKSAGGERGEGSRLVRGRDETLETVARRLRTSFVLLVAWWFVSGSRPYRYILNLTFSEQSTARTLFTLAENAAVVALVYTVLVSLFRLFISPPQPTSPSTATTSTSALKSALGLSTTGAVGKPAQAQAPGAGPRTALSFVPSSPKTRPSPAMPPSPSILRGRFSTPSPSPSPKRSPNRPPSSAPRVPIPGDPFGQSISNRGLGNAFGFGAGVGSGSVGGVGGNVPGAEGGVGVGAGSSVKAYWSRHSPRASPLHRSISTPDDLDRLLDDEG